VYVLLAILGLAVLVVLHEAGHFVAAKLVGMRVERFSLFFGPMIAKVRRGETEYGIGTIPLGGYVKITGMNPEEVIPPEAEGRAYYQQPVWKRVLVIFAGPAVNLVIAFVVIAALFWSHGYVDTSVSAVGAVAAKPALGVLRKGDEIVAVDGRHHLNFNKVVRAISSDRCAGTPTFGCAGTTPLQLTIRRDGRLQSISITPRYDAKVKRMRLGIQIADGVARPLGVLHASSMSLSQMWWVTHTTVTKIATIFEPKVRSQIHGVVGVVDVTGQQIQKYGLTQALYMLAIVSLSLAVINLFPFLPLDGGHIFWALAEKVRGRRIPLYVMERAGAVGFVLIVMLFVIGFTNDISTITGSGFNVR
jgi:regulator of sigma E protease